MSVGHVARAIEEAGIPTVIAMSHVFAPRVRAMTVPRLLTTRHIMGRPLGAPGDAARQRAVILDALKLLESATQAGTVLERPEAYRVAP